MVGEQGVRAARKEGFPEEVSLEPHSKETGKGGLTGEQRELPGESSTAFSMCPLSP